MATNARIFPEGFRFGVADADLQVVGEAHTISSEGSCPTMWGELAATSGAVFENSTPHEAIDRYNRFSEDVGFITALGVKNYRTSVSMSRLLKQDGTVNTKAVEWYRRYFSQLTKAGIGIHATLYHWELPMYLHEKGGWTSRATVDMYVKHVEAVHEHLGDLISEYHLINEHVCIALFGYHVGWHAPFEKDFGKALLAGHNLLIAQGLGFNALKSRDASAKISTVCNPMTVYATETTSAGLQAQALQMAYSTYWWIDPLFTGVYPEDAQAAWERYLPKISASDMSTIKIGAGLESLGLNYYCGMMVAPDETSVTKGQWTRRDFGIKNGLGWPVYVPPEYPSGLYDLLLSLHNRYALLGLKKLRITENGCAYRSERLPNGTINDQFRIDYIEAHLKQVHDAILAGVPVDAYFAWTLMDNYEWAEGYRPDSAFGLIHVDRKDFTRTPKASYHWFKNVVARHQIGF